MSDKKQIEFQREVIADEYKEYIQANIDRRVAEIVSQAKRKKGA